MSSGSLHLCGCNCDSATTVGTSERVCRLTSRVLGGISQAGMSTVGQGTLNFNTAQSNKRKRHGSLKKAKRVSARGPSADFLKGGPKKSKVKKSKKKTTNRRTETTQSERMIISKVIQLLLFYRDHIPPRTAEDSEAVCKTAINHSLRRAGNEIVRVPHLVASAFEAVPHAEGRNPLIPTNHNLVQKIAEFLVEFVCRAFSHFRSTRVSIARFLKEPESRRAVQISKGHIDNVSSQVTALQFTVELLMLCCTGVRSIADKRVLVPCIPFLTVFIPRTNQLRLIFDGADHKTLLNMGWFMEMADMLFVGKCVPRDPSFAVSNLFVAGPSRISYRSHRMLLTASATASSSTRAMTETEPRTSVCASDIISVPPLTQDYASDLSTRGVDGKKPGAFWCCLLQTDTGQSAVAAATEEVENFKSLGHLLLVFGTWTTREKVNAVIGEWELSPDAVANGFSIIEELRRGKMPDLRIFASDSVRS